MAKELPIPFKLINIDETQFSVFEESLENEAPVSQNISIGFSTDPDKNIVGVSFQYQLEKEEKPFLKIEVECYFEIEASEFKKQLMKKGEIILPCNFAKHLTVITTGTVRGVLYANTKNTPFSEYFLGLVNVDDMFTEDIVLNLSPSEII